MSKSFSLKPFASKLENLDQTASIEPYKALIKECRGQLYSDYLNNVSAAKIVKNYTAFIDLLICHIWTSSNLEKQSASLLAVGGYGRGELHPYSDIDLLIGSFNPSSKNQRDNIGKFVRFLWDIGLEVGHSVRTIKESIQLAKKDITVLTTLMESRALVDEQGFVDELLDKLNSKKFWPAPKYTAAKISEQYERHLAFDDTEHNLEPNIKDGPGGLRDIQTIVWVAGRHYNKVDLNVLSEEKILSLQESKTLTRCRNFLWKLRIGLHLHAKRKEDRLLFDHQRSLATDFGHEDSKN